MIRSMHATHFSTVKLTHRGFREQAAIRDEKKKEIQGTSILGSSGKEV